MRVHKSDELDMHLICIGTSPSQGRSQGATVTAVGTGTERDRDRAGLKGNPEQKRESPQEQSRRASGSAGGRATADATIGKDR